MSKNVLQTIRSRTDSFSRGQKRIADYILMNYDKAAFMTAGHLGRKAQVSESTVVRFASQLGYDGYPNMQRALQELVRGKLTCFTATITRRTFTRNMVAVKHLLIFKMPV